MTLTFLHLLIPLVTPLVIAGIKMLTPRIPKPALPILAPFLGAGLEVLTTYTTNMPGTNGLAGALLGLAGIGVRELVDQVKSAAAAAKTAMLLFVLLVPAPALAVGGEEAARESVKAVEKAIGKTIFHEAARGAAEHPELVGIPPAGHAAKATAPSFGPHAAATSHLLSQIIVGTAVAGIFIALLVYDLTHPGPPAFAGQQWDTCANATITYPDDRCRPFLNGRSY